MKNKKLTVIRIILAVLLIADMAVIFWGSSQTASQSSKLSSGLAKKLMEAEAAHKKPAATKPVPTTAEQPSDSPEKTDRADAESPPETVNAAEEEMKRRVELSKKDETLRTLAHMGEFASLGVLSAFFMYSLFYGRLPLLTSSLCSAVFGVLYALSDEIHQIFVKGRTFEWSDIGIDSLGCILGVCAALLIYCIAQGRHRAPRGWRLQI